VRSGLYRFVWEGQDAKGAWHEIIQSTHEVKLPNLVVTIIENQFENWKEAVTRGPAGGTPPMHRHNSGRSGQQL
jgi:hypothetical protein